MQTISTIRCVSCFALLGVLAHCSERPQVRISESSLHVVTVGSGALVTVVLHGGPGLRHNYLRPEWDELRNLGRVIYYDQRGCGRSALEGPYSWKQHVQDLDSLLTSVSPERPVVLAGSSWGSYLALLYAYEHPNRVAALVLSGLVEMWPGGHHAWMDEISPAVRAELELAESSPVVRVDFEDSASVANRSSLDPKLAKRFGTACTGPSRTALSYSLRSAPSLDSLHNITVPALLFRGAKPDGLKDGAEMFAKVLPNAELVTIDAGHDPWFEQPKAFFRAVRRFLRNSGVAHLHENRSRTGPALTRQVA